MKVAITGATGIVGRQLVPLLSAAGMDLLLVGRDPTSLEKIFSNLPTSGVADLATAGKGIDILLHLSARNNDRPGTIVDFDHGNVDHALHVLEQARAAGIPRFIYVSTVHALATGNRSSYAESKRRGALAILAAAGNIDASILYLPFVQGKLFAGKLSFLNCLPPVLHRPTSYVLAALRPTVNVERLALYMRSGAPAGEDGRLILSDAKKGNAVYTAAMRLIDYSFALTIIFGFWWLLLVTWIAVRCDSSGPAIFGQTRIGRYGKLFTCWKFRTMQVGTEQAGTHEVSASAVTRVGAFLRRTRIDELPQVWNILRGEIALIGPRPCLPVQTYLIEARQQRGVLDVLPGISGLAQVEGIDMSDPIELARRDADYIALRGILPDISLILRTIFRSLQSHRINTS